MSQRIVDLMEKYSKRDFDALSSLYFYRCLSMEQLYKLHYSTSIKGTREVSMDYLKKKLSKMKQDGLITATEKTDNNLPILFSLARDGVTMVKLAKGFEANVYNDERRLAKRGYLTCSEINVSPRFMSHQYHLNQFAIEADEIINKYEIPHKYKDEKHLDSCITVRPDAMVTTDKFDIYYEMDMGTENLASLEEKWVHYRMFFGSSEYKRDKKIIILFICNDRKTIQNRIKIVKDSIAHYFLNDVNDKVEVYVGPQKKLLAVMRAKIIPEYLGAEVSIINDLRTLLTQNDFKIADSSQLSGKFNDKNYTFYACNEKKNLQFMVQEFLGEPVSVMKKAYDYNFDSQAAAIAFTEKIPLLIVGTSEDSIYTNNNVFSIPSDNICYTTLNRLENLPLNAAIFKILNGKVAHFDNDFSNLIMETVH